MEAVESVKLNISYKEILAFVNTAKEFQNNKERKPSALTYAISRMLKRLDSHVEDYKELVSDAQNKYQKKDKDGVFEYHDEKCTQPKYTAEDHSKFRKEFASIQNKNVQVEQYLCQLVPKDLELAWYDYFVPFVIADYPQPSEAQ